MTHTLDAYGQRVTNAAQETMRALDIFGKEWISYGPNLGVLFQAASKDTRCPLANAYAALLHMSLEAEQGYAAAKPFIERLSTNTESVTPREHAIIDAALFWQRQDYKAALEAFERALELAPADIVAAKWGQYLAFNLGRADAMLRLAKHILPAHRSTAEAWGMLAFAQEQSHQLHLAADSAMEALSLNPNEAWAQHALAHVYETHGCPEEGISLLTSVASGWSTRSIFMREHNYWHLALFHLDRDETAKALEIYDKHLWGDWPEFAQEQIGAISLLWRLELRGVDVGDRWAPVIGQVQERGHEHLWPFHDLHYVLALSQASPPTEAARFLASMKATAERKGGVWSEVALPAAVALVSCSQGRYDEASQMLTPLIPDLHHIGGSHAQRDVFVQTWIEASQKARTRIDLEAVLRERLKSRPSILAHQRDLDRWLKKPVHSTS